MDRTQGGEACNQVQLAAAQADLLEHSSLLSVASLPARALPPASPGTTKPSAAERWQYAAFQTLLYGAEIYLPLLQKLPDWFAHQALIKASIRVQRFYRKRLFLKFQRTVQGQIAEQARRERVAKAKKAFRAAMLVQVRMIALPYACSRKSSATHCAWPLPGRRTSESSPQLT